MLISLAHNLLRDRNGPDFREDRTRMTPFRHRPSAESKARLSTIGEKFPYSMELTNPSIVALYSSFWLALRNALAFAA